MTPPFLFPYLPHRSWRSILRFTAVFASVSSQQSLNTFPPSTSCKYEDLSQEAVALPGGSNPVGKTLLSSRAPKGQGGRGEVHHPNHYPDRDDNGQPIFHSQRNNNNNLQAVLHSHIAYHSRSHDHNVCSADDDCSTKLFKHGTNSSRISPQRLVRVYYKYCSGYWRCETNQRIYHRRSDCFSGNGCSSKLSIHLGIDRS